MKILHVLSQTEMTGAEVYAQNLIKFQIDQGHKVFVVSEKMHVNLPIPWISLPLGTGNRLRRMISILRLRKLIQENRIDLIHCHSRGAVRHAAWARWATPAAMVTTLHGRQHSSFSKKLFNLYGELLIAVCENVKRSTSRNFKIHPDQIEVIGNPFSSDLFQQPSVRPLSDTDRSNQVNLTKHFNLAIIGRSSGPKGKRFEEIGNQYFQNWLQSLPQLKISLIVPSLSGFSENFQRILKDLSAEFKERFQILSHVENLQTELPKFDLVLGSGRVAIESILANTPVFALGEYCSHGMIQSQNLPAAIETNFGDMGDESLQIDFDAAEVDRVLQESLKKKKQTNLSNGFARNENLDLISMLESYFSEKIVNQKIIHLYQRALFKRKHSQWIPALMYHKIPEAEINSPHRIFVTRENFKRHLQFFKSQNFETIHFKDLYEYIYKNNCQNFAMGRNFPKKPLLLSFDDGYLDNLTLAEPLLKTYQMKAHIYLLANSEFKENTWDTQAGDVGSPIMSAEQRKKLDLSVWEIGSHGLHHAKLPEVNDNRLQEEVRESKKILEKEFATEIFSFAYPFGLRNERVEATTRETYDFAVNTDQGALHLADNPWSIFRVNIFPEDGPLQLRKKCSRFYRKYFYRKRGR